MHKMRLVHRDIKPDNTFINIKDGEKEVGLGDFGTARYINESNEFKLERNESINTTTVGSGFYTSPEMKAEKPNGTQTDLWSFGVTIGVIIGLDDICPVGYKGGVPGFIKDCAAGKHDLWLHEQEIYISPVFTPLLKNILMVDPSKRFTMQQVLDHPYVTKNLE